jgi:Ala-tRNA(Pro) deacylase
LNLRLTNNFVPSVGDNFLIETYASRSGQYAFVRPPSLPQNVAFQLDSSSPTQLFVRMVTPTAQTYTSTAEARALGIDASEVLKTVAMRVAGGYALMAVPATCRLDMHLVRAAAGDPHARLATEEELLRDFPGIELGALPPLGSLLGAPLYVDQEVLQHETVVFAAGSQTESVQIKTADLLQHEQVTTLPLIKHADENGKDWLR